MTTPRNTTHFRSRLLKTHIMIYMSIVLPHRHYRLFSTKSFSIPNGGIISMCVYTEGCGFSPAGVFLPAMWDIYGINRPPIQCNSPSPLVRLRDIYHGYYKC